jgi:hypothetical protein
MNGEPARQVDIPQDGWPGLRRATVSTAGING